MSSESREETAGGDDPESSSPADDGATGNGATGESATGTAESSEPTEESVTEAELAVLREENDRLRAEFRRAKQTTYRRTMVAFLGFGVASLLASLFFPATAELLVALGGIGVFGAILTYFVTPETFQTASVSDHVSAALSKNGERLVAELGLQDDRVYVPVGEQSVRLYVPASRNFDLPPVEALKSILVVTGSDRQRGLSLHPTGSELYPEFDRAADSAGDLEQATAQLADAVVEQFELAGGVSASIRPVDAEVRFEVSGSNCGPVSRFDQPTVSFLATGLAIWTDSPVEVEVEDGEPGLVRCRLDGGDNADGANDAADLAESQESEESMESTDSESEPTQS